MSDTVIQCEQVGKKFCKSLRKSMLYGGLDLLQGIFMGAGNTSRLREDEFWAINQVSFELKKGESLGIIGPNGSGKTTLLKMLNGIFMPDQGRITLKGRVGALIQVGAGFHPMLTGRENIYVNGTILGLSKSEIDRSFDSIVDFADIGDFLDSPVKFYSSGMYVRLGFAIAIHCRPDILLIDEILAVGDLKFQTKCLKFITQHILKNQCTLIFVSHNRYAVEDVCQKALYINHGRMVKMGQTSQVIAQYLDDIRQQETSSSQGVLASQGITRVEFLDEHGVPRQQFESGQKMSIRFHYSFKEPVVRPSVGISFMHDDPRYALASSTDYLLNFHSGYDGLLMEKLCGVGYFEVAVDAFYLPVGQYRCSLYLFSENHMNLIRKDEDALRIEVCYRPHQPQRSLMDLARRWTIQEGGQP